MKIKFFIPILIIFFYSSSFAQVKNNINTPGANEFILKNSLIPNAQKAMQANVSEDWYNQAVKKIDQLDYAFFQKNNANEFISYNKLSRLDFDLRPQGLHIKSNTTEPGAGNWENRIELAGITKGDQSWDTGNFINTNLDASKLRFIYHHFEVEYINDRSGMRQNFIINERPAGNQMLSIKLLLGKKFHYELKEANKLYCYSEDLSTGTPQLIYDDLKVWDATGAILPAHMELIKNKLSIVVNDQDAVYPITVDPLSHVAEWTTSANGVLTTILTTGQLQIDALYGLNVAGLGDVNGDGYDDVAIGAPGAINVLAGPSTIVGAGAVFVYFGTDSGLSTTPNKVLRATTPVANALFGFSVAGGNVTGNSRNDIIVGAPGDRYTASVSGFPTTANVTAGKVYVFKGEDMSLGSPTPLLSVYLNGSTYFTNGIAAVLGSNISINALFGFSVAATEDMTGDGLGEIVVGSPGYAELGLVPIRSGAAFVFYSGNLATNSPVKLTAPSSSLLDLALVNNQGLLFGFSVDGAGDYNKDGKPDIVVGAPAGVTVSLGNLLGGTAYIYKGTGAGVNTTAITQLKATASLISNISNLFGYSVRGVKNANGTRNGNVLIGAPSGNLLSNLLNGLKLKAGSVNVFKAKNMVLSEEYPAQTIQSPRGSSLLSILGGQNLDVSALFGASIDNMLDVNCDGINDIIIGEPLSTSVGIISANVIGGAATIYLGKSDGTYNTTPFWNLENQVSYNAGINAGSLLGYSVAGAGHVRGQMQGVRCLIGAPGAALDFSSGIFNLGNTFGTLFSFAAGNNGLGKSYMYGFNNCNVIYNPDVNVTYVNVPVPGNVNTNDVVPSGTTYGTPVPSGSNISGGSINMQPDGTYIFTSTNPGIFVYYVPVCLPGESMPCTPVELTITVLTAGISTNPPVANTDIATTMSAVPVTLETLDNDRCYNIGCTLTTSSVQVTVSPKYGTASVNPSTGDITYTSYAGYFGKDTLTYVVCDNSGKCASAKQIITVLAPGVSNTTLAADDYITTYQNSATIGNVKPNDTDPENDEQTVTAQTTTIPGVGTLILNTDGSFSFSPVNGFTGPVSFPYTTCDNGTPSVCADATLYILVMPMGTPLAVNISALSYTQKNCGVQLNWTSIQDNDVRQYFIENSVNGVDWMSIGILVPRTSTTGKNDYSFQHPNPVKGANYYRLIIIDNSGRRTYSNILNANVSCANVDIVVNPNPFTDKLMIYFASEKAETVTVKLFDNAGKAVVTKQIAAKEGSNQVKLKDLGSLASGAYFISVKTSAGELKQKLVK
ncbi:MAG: Ig-like domain-containing protein [Ferruginibacter sp.]